ncbi:type II secretion system F family protein [Butyrivibrio proteoclasticus]|uniref:type II secretion system F family protein n=1 Tax=Butyrivibrio proteoclasticus TaxID=43305 RepID=UPI00047E8CC5|nr:type II secretion system F family protein [Butyrivibrio proteoclasticus]
MFFIIYLACPVFILVLWFFSKDLELPDTIVETGISRELLKISLFIYKKLNKRKFRGKEKVRTYLGSLSYQKDMGKALCDYYIRKISIVLILAFAGSILAFLIHLSSQSGSILDQDSNLIRNDYGQGDFTAYLEAEDEEGNLIGDFDVLIGEQLYTEEETKTLFDEASAEMEKLVLKDNESFDKVTSDLDLMEKLPGYPFEISWRIDNYQVIHFDGALIEDNIPKGGEIITLTATYKYNDLSYVQVMHANICPKELTKEQEMFKAIAGLIDKADKDSVYEKKVALPQAYGDKTLIWKERIEDNSFIFLVLMLAAGGASFVLKDKELKKKMEERDKQMLNDYPQFVSQLVLYLGAGMTMRNIFERLSASYQKKKKKTLEKRYLYEEVERSGRELLSGMSEGSVYENFGLRCGGQQFARLSTLLSQNLKKGNGELLKLLQEESQKAFDDRLDKTRKIGEEAGTKLLLPMIMMLVIVMVIIMIPAYLAF